MNAFKRLISLSVATATLFAGTNAYAFDYSQATSKEKSELEKFYSYQLSAIGKSIENGGTLTAKYVMSSKNPSDDNVLALGFFSNYETAKLSPDKIDSIRYDVLEKASKKAVGLARPGFGWYGEYLVEGSSQVFDQWNTAVSKHYGELADVTALTKVVQKKNLSSFQKKYLASNSLFGVSQKADEIEKAAFNGLNACYLSSKTKDNMKVCLRNTMFVLGAGNVVNKNVSNAMVIGEKSFRSTCALSIGKLFDTMGNKECKSMSIATEDDILDAEAFVSSGAYGKNGTLATALKLNKNKTYYYKDGTFGWSTLTVDSKGTVSKNSVTKPKKGMITVITVK